MGETGRGEVEIPIYRATKKKVLAQRRNVFKTIFFIIFLCELGGFA